MGPPSSLLPTTTILSNMVHPTDAQHFAATYDPNPPRSRQSSGLLGSIWAPQPQPSETTWPRTLDSFSRVAERESDPTSRQDGRAAALRQIVSREDVFGSPQPTQAQQVSGREVGAIGDGRKKNSPDYGDTVRLSLPLSSASDSLSLMGPLAC
jgi:pumilio RNA-binding family